MKAFIARGHSTSNRVEAEISVTIVFFATNSSFFSSTNAASSLLVSSIPDCDASFLTSSRILSSNNFEHNP